MVEKSGSVRNVAKRLLRPLWARVWARVEHRVQPIEAAIGDLSNDLSNQLTLVDRRLAALENGWRQHVPGLLNAVSSVAALGYELAALRREMLVNADETREGNVTLQPEFGMLSSNHRVVAERFNVEISKAARILSPHKLEKARALGIKLNLGCGHVPLDGYINVDRKELPGVDIVSDVGNLPFEKLSLTEIFSAHLLEHVPQERLRLLLPYWHSLLEPKGIFRAVVPDGEAMLAGIAAGRYSFEHFREVLFGSQEYEGGFHLNLFTADTLTKLLQESGFDQIRVPVKGRKNDICFEFEVIATK